MVAVATVRFRLLWVLVQRAVRAEEQQLVGQVTQERGRGEIATARHDRGKPDREFFALKERQKRQLSGCFRALDGQGNLVDGGSGRELPGR